MNNQPDKNEQSITLNRLSDGERAKLIAAASSKQTGVLRQTIGEELQSREMWLHIFQSVLASEGVAVEEQADVTRAAFNTSSPPITSETKIITKLVKNLSASDEASLIDEIQKAIDQAEQDKQFSLLRKLIAVLWELERIAAIKRQDRSA